MPPTDTIPASYAYAMRIVELWLNCYDMSIKYRKDSMMNTADPEMSQEYAAQLSRLWLELYPKIKDRTDMNPKDFPAQFEKFRTYYFNPDALLEEKNGDEIYNLEMIIREAMEKLYLTRFDV